jgi:hypothetical protein
MREEGPSKFQRLCQLYVTVRIPFALDFFIVLYCFKKEKHNTLFFSQYYTTNEVRTGLISLWVRPIAGSCEQGDQMPNQSHAGNS